MEKDKAVHGDVEVIDGLLDKLMEVRGVVRQTMREAADTSLVSPVSNSGERLINGFTKAKELMDEFAKEYISHAELWTKIRGQNIVDSSIFASSRKVPKVQADTRAGLLTDRIFVWEEDVADVRKKVVSLDSVADALKSFEYETLSRLDDMLIAKQHLKNIAFAPFQNHVSVVDIQVTSGNKVMQNYLEHISLQCTRISVEVTEAMTVDLTRALSDLASWLRAFEDMLRSPCPKCGRMMSCVDITDLHEQLSKRRGPVPPIVPKKRYFTDANGTQDANMEMNDAEGAWKLYHPSCTKQRGDKNVISN